MTLKEYLDKNKIKTIGDQRSEIGRYISKLEHDFSYVIEDGFNVKNYNENFLTSKDVSEIIISQLNQ